MFDNLTYVSIAVGGEHVSLNGCKKKIQMKLI